MYHYCGYTRETMSYLNRFDEILETMIRAMTKAPLTDSISHNFIVQMIPHHRAAVDMSANILRYTRLAPLQTLAETIIREQTLGITHMENLLPSCAALENPCKDVCLYQWHTSRIISTMFSDMRNACADNQISADFLREMIPHHRGAVQMSQNALKFQLCPGLPAILESIITTQKKEICQMEQLLCQISPDAQKNPVLP